MSCVPFLPPRAMIFCKKESERRQFEFLNSPNPAAGERTVHFQAQTLAPIPALQIFRASAPSSLLFPSHTHIYIYQERIINRQIRIINILVDWMVILAY